jgi:hypothetical protein
MFDEAFYTDQGTNGGRLKRGCLLGRDVDRLVKFSKRPALNSLVRDLTETFVVRYEKPPTAEELDILYQAQKDPNPSPLITLSTPFQYIKRTEELVQSRWLVDTFRRHLKDREAWPKADKAVLQQIHSGEPNTSSRKRKSDQAKLESNLPRLGKIPKSDGGTWSSDTVFGLAQEGPLIPYTL